jgi:hypothetical protein
MNVRLQTLDREGQANLASAIGESPETLMTIEQLRRGLCHATVATPPDRPLAAIIQPHAFPTDATAFGVDPDLLWQILSSLDGWRRRSP